MELWNTFHCIWSTGFLTQMQTSNNYTQSKQRWHFAKHLCTITVLLNFKCDVLVKKEKKISHVKRKLAHRLQGCCTPVKSYKGKKKNNQKKDLNHSVVLSKGYIKGTSLQTGEKENQDSEKSQMESFSFQPSAAPPVLLYHLSALHGVNWPRFVREWCRIQFPAHPAEDVPLTTAQDLHWGAAGKSFPKPPREENSRSCTSTALRHHSINPTAVLQASSSQGLLMSNGCFTQLNCAIQNAFEQRV